VETVGDSRIAPSPGRIDRCHVSQNVESRLVGNSFKSSRMSRTCPSRQTETAVHAIHHRVVRNVFALQNVHAAIRHVVARHACYGCVRETLRMKRPARQESFQIHGKRQICHYVNVSVSSQIAILPSTTSNLGISFPVRPCVGAHHKNRKPAPPAETSFTNGAQTKMIAS